VSVPVGTAGHTYPGDERHPDSHAIEPLGHLDHTSSLATQTSWSRTAATPSHSDRVHLQDLVTVVVITLRAIRRWRDARRGA
jgi:hypothetical protein